MCGEAGERDSCEHDDVIMKISCGFIATMHVVLTIIGSPGLELEAVRAMRKSTRKCVVPIDKYTTH